MMVVIVLFSEVLLFRKGKSFPQPFFQLAGPLALVREVVTEAPAVAAGRIDMQRGGYFLFAQGEEVTDAVDGQYGCVIGGQHDEACGVWGDTCRSSEYFCSSSSEGASPMRFLREPP